MERLQAIAPRARFVKAFSCVGRAHMVDPDFGASEGMVDFGSFQLPLYRQTTHGEVDPEELGLDPLKREELLRKAQEQSTEPPPSPEPQPPQR